MFIENDYGCGKPGCILCARSKKAFANLEGWNEARKGNKVGLEGVDSYFEGQIKAKNQEIDRLNAQIKPLREKRDAIKAEVELLEKARKAVADVAPKPETIRKRGSFYYLPSRTGESGGHYIERFLDNKEPLTRCSCQAGMFGRRCWAQEEVRTRPFGNIHRKSYLTPAAFDRAFERAAANNR